MIVRWLPLVALPAFALTVTQSSAPRWGIMWLLAGATYFACKWLSWFASARPPAPLLRKLAWWLAWPGMDANRFLVADSSQQPMNEIEWASAFFKTALGIGLFIIAGKSIARGSAAAAWLGMVAFILSIHCGSFHLLSCLWRSIGWRAEPLMNRPLASRSIAEFWGRRWNCAFRDLTYPAIFRPLATCCGPAIGTLAVFAFSGLVHELVISIPAGGGFGLPTLYFVLQGLAVLLENRLSRNQTSKLLGRPIAAVVIAAPLPLLFHPPFINVVVVPFVKAISP
jgi:hypothetical protein